MQINDNCVGCGLCVIHCPTRCLKIQNNKRIYISQDQCHLCGHCFAICPHESIQFNNIQSQDCKIDFSQINQLHTLVKYRRSIRSYKQQDVDQQILIQSIQFIKYQNEYKDNIKIKLVNKQNLKQLGELAANELSHLNNKYFQQQQKYDIVLRGCSQLLVIYIEKSDNLFYQNSLKYNAIKFATQLELLLQQQNIGTFWCGMIQAASENKTNNVKNFLHIQNNQQIVCCLGLGIPNIVYFRSVPRMDYQIDFTK